MIDDEKAAVDIAEQERAAERLIREGQLTIGGMPTAAMQGVEPTDWLDQLPRAAPRDQTPCKATKADGAACTWPASTNRGYCFVHDPDKERKSEEASRLLSVSVWLERGSARQPGEIASLTALEVVRLSLSRNPVRSTDGAEERQALEELFGGHKRSGAILKLIERDVFELITAEPSLVLMASGIAAGEWIRRDEPANNDQAIATLLKLFARELAEAYLARPESGTGGNELRRLLVRLESAAEKRAAGNIIRGDDVDGRLFGIANIEQRADSIAVAASTLYHQARAILANGHREFGMGDGVHWPTAMISRREVDAMMQVRPSSAEVDPFVISPAQLAQWQQVMATRVMQMDDLTADVLDAICALWLDRAQHPRDDVVVSADQLLKMRGLLPKLGGQNRRGGYSEKQRCEIARQIAVLRDTWMTVTRMTVTKMEQGKRGMHRTRVPWAGEAPVLVVEFRAGPIGFSGQVDPERCTLWAVRPGAIFADFLIGPGRETALLAKRALEYDPYRQTWEKRLARYFSWLWRVRQKNGSYSDPIAVQTLLDAVRERVSQSDPARTKERLEKALDRLRDDRVIAGWQYDRGDEESIDNRHGWVHKWLTWTIAVEPPTAVPNHYLAIKSPVPRLASIPPLLGQRLLECRTTRGLTLMQAAEEIGVGYTQLSRLERGLRQPSATTRAKIKRWIDGTGPAASA